MKVLLKSSDYHYRIFFIRNSLAFFRSIAFKKNFLLSVLLHLPFLYFAFVHKPDASIETIQVTFAPIAPIEKKQETVLVEENIDSLSKDITLPQENKDSKEQPTENSKRENKKVDTTMQKSETLNKQTQEPTNKGSSPTNTLPNNIPPAQYQTQQNFQSQFEKETFSAPVKTADQVASIPPASSSQNWQKDQLLKKGQEKTEATTTKKNSDGNDKGKIRWQGGRSRKTLYLPQVQYPAYYLSKGIQARGVFSIEIDAGGSVIAVHTLQSTGYPGLDVEAKNALRAARFSVVEDSRQIDRGDIDVEFKLR